MIRFQTPPNTPERVAEVFVTDGLGSCLNDAYTASDTRMAQQAYQAAQKRQDQSAIQRWNRQYQACYRRDVERALHGLAWIACDTCEPRNIIIGSDEADLAQQAQQRGWTQHGKSWQCQGCCNHVAGYAQTLKGADL